MMEPISLHEQGGLLAFDLARSTGWCYAPPGYQPPPMIEPDAEYRKLVSGTVEFGKPGDVHGAMFLSAHGFCARMIPIYRPSYIALERPFFSKFTAPAAAVCMGLAAIVRMHATHHGIPMTDASPQELKRYWTGNARAMKPDMIKFCRMRGLSPKTDDEADAQALCDWACASLGASALWPPKQKANVA